MFGERCDKINNVSATSQKAEEIVGEKKNSIHPLIYKITGRQGRAQAQPLGLFPLSFSPFFSSIGQSCPLIPLPGIPQQQYSGWPTTLYELWQGLARGTIVQLRRVAAKVLAIVISCSHQRRTHNCLCRRQ